MNFLTMQSLGTYTKNMEMKMKWQQKKTNHDFTADGSTKLNDPIARQAEEIRKSQADGSSKLSSQIRMKLANGKKLTQEEMEYLQKNDPQTYQKVKSIEAEKKSYEEELKKCKTKEDVQRVRMNRTAASLSVVNSVKNNPAIPESAKLGVMWQELQKNMALEETINKFIESGRYAKLPTEAEKTEAEKELKEAEKIELGIEEPAENAEESRLVEKEAETEHVKEDALADMVKDTVAHEAVQRSRALLQEQKKTRADAEAAPEVLKVKRARAQAAYKENRMEIPDQIMDFKVE